jgi:cytosine/adenosine deaminase-related metal-dependent hydrolase
MVPKPFCIHSSLLFDPKKKEFVKDVSLSVDPATGTITAVWERTSPLRSIPPEDIDLRGQVVMPGFVDAHTHIFLHSYE